MTKTRLTVTSCCLRILPTILGKRERRNEQIRFREGNGLVHEDYFGIARFVFFDKQAFHLNSYIPNENLFLCSNSTDNSVLKCNSPLHRSQSMKSSDAEAGKYVVI